MSLKFSLVENLSGRNITVLVDGELYTADDSNPSFDQIVAGARAGDATVVRLFDVAKAVTAAFERLSERVTVAGGHVYFDGEEIHSTLSNQVVRFMNEGQDFGPLVNFWEKLATNPNEHSREQLYDWLSAEGFSITADGDLVGYKYVNDQMQSVHAGPGIVNGVPQNGHLDNSVGNVVEMARSQVAHDPSQACSVGLHVGTWGYSGGYSTVVKVLVNPRDVVSVPSDSGGNKMRVCRYKVVEVVNNPTLTAVDPYSEDDDEDDDYAYFNPVWTASSNSTVWDTKKNYTLQTRQAGGRFGPRKS